MLKVAWNASYTHPLPEGHRFPMAKYDLLPEQLLYEGTITEAHLFSPHPATEVAIISTHEEEYWQRLKGLQLTRAEERKTGFPHSASLVHRERVIMQGTIDAAAYALKYGIAMNSAGGTHHAYANRGEGFCLLNDIAMGAHHLLQHQLAHKILVVDLDVHQGNGTASIFRHNPHVFTFSMHGAKNYPLHKEQSDLDLPVPDGITDAPYLELLQNTLPRLVDEQMPDFIFYQSGVDVLATDKLGRLGLTLEGCKQRDRMVLQLCKQHQIPVACSMGGGYSEHITHIVEAHANTYRLAQEIFF